VCVCECFCSFAFAFANRWRCRRLLASFFLFVIRFIIIVHRSVAHVCNANGEGASERGIDLSEISCVVVAVAAAADTFFFCFILYVFFFIFLLLLLFFCFFLLCSGGSGDDDGQFCQALRRQPSDNICICSRWVSRFRSLGQSELKRS